MTCKSIITTFHSFLNAAAKNSVRQSEGMAEGGCGGNSAMPEREKKVDSPAVLLESAGHHRKILFSLGEKEIRRAQNEKSKEYFSVVGRAERATAGLASLVGVLRKMSSDFFKQTPQNRKLLAIFCFVALRRIELRFEP